jgi:hypothetical protein
VALRRVGIDHHGTMYTRIIIYIVPG